MKRNNVAVRILVAVALLAVIGARMWRSDWKHILGGKPKAERSIHLSHPQRKGEVGDAQDDHSIELSDRFGNVENGSAYDRASIDLGDAKKVVLPENALIRRTTEMEKVQLFMKKTMSFYGHRSEPMSIRDVRKKMGCAVKREGDALVIATFGEWDSRSEGDTHMRLVAILPLKFASESRKGLSGPSSAGTQRDGKLLSDPAQGWAALPDVPDFDLVAKYRR